MPYKTERESRAGVEHGFGERRSDKAGLNECTGRHVVVVVVVAVAVAVRDIDHHSRTATTRTILKETAKTHQRRPFSFVFFPLPPFPSSQISFLFFSTKFTSSTGTNFFSQTQ